MNAILNNLFTHQTSETEAATDNYTERLETGGNPRGCCVKLILPSGRWNSMGGAEDGFCVPVR